LISNHVFYRIILFKVFKNLSKCLYFLVDIIDRASKHRLST